jgi:hypothetical protein
VEGEAPYDFSMLIPQFTGSPIRYVDRAGEDITGQVANPVGFVKVDATYGLSYSASELDNREFTVYIYTVNRRVKVLWLHSNRIARWL